MKNRKLLDDIDQIPDNTHWDDFILDVYFSDQTPFIALPRDFTLHTKEYLSMESVPLHPPGYFYGTEA